MIYPTFDFLLFAIPVLVGFWALAGKPVARVLFLLGASYLFYMAGPKTVPPPAPPYSVGLLIFSTLLDFVCGRQLHRFEPDLQSDDEGKARRAKLIRRLYLAASLIGNLGLLAYFKYVNFFIQAFVDTAASVGWSVEGHRLDVILPLGISFYTFQSLSYTLDIYRGRLTPEPSLRRFALFVVFFPQLVAGPIVRAKQFLPQLQRGPRFSREHMEEGAFRICKGLFKKVVLGDWIAIHMTDLVFDQPETYTSPELMIALYAYTLQLYADFSGYSDVAIGLGRMLGFEIPENFDRPYQAKDIAEYWRRWHMTLSSWLRDYLFFPLLGRFGARHGYWALWLTMFLVGMWHGASWNFVIYANMHAAAMVFNRWNKRRDRNASWGRRLVFWPLATAGFWVAMAGLGHWVLALTEPDAKVFGAVLSAVFLLVCWLPARGGRFNTVVHVFLTLHYLACSRIFFRAPDIETAQKFVAGLLHASPDHLIRPGFMSGWLWVAMVAGLAYHFTPKRWVDVHLRGLFGRIPGVGLGVLFVGLIYGLMKLLEGQPRAFIYFQF